MKIYVAFDDTDTLDCGRGTGKLARWFVDKLPEGCYCWGIVRQQLLHEKFIPMTSHNSSLCVVVEAPDDSCIPVLIERGAQHIKEHFEPGSDPGLCVVSENNPAIHKLVTHGLNCIERKVSQEEAYKAAEGLHLSGHGGTNDGIIGAAAGVGLTFRGDSGRFVAYKDSRELPAETNVETLTSRGIKVMSVNRHAEVPKPTDIVDNQGSLRPRLFAGQVVLPVISTGARKWKTISEKAVYLEEEAV